jgi:dolichyl-phosphate beta-glucosyltransferase
MDRAETPRLDARSAVRELAIVVPAYNEAQRIEPTLEKILAFLPGRFESSEVLLVDDGSTDGTADLVESRFAGRVRVIRNPMRRGKGSAVRAGVLAAQKAWILFVDADLSIPIDETLVLCSRADRAAVVIGSKRAPGSRTEYPPLRRWLGGVGNLLISLFVVSGFHDTQCGIKLYRADAGKELFGASRIDGFGFDFEVLFLARRLGWDVEEVPVRCEHKVGGTVRLRTYLRVLSEVARVTSYRLRGLYPRRRPRTTGFGAT